MARFKLNTDDGRTLDIECESDSDLAMAWNEWKSAPERSSRERAAWTRITEAADELLYEHDGKEFLDTYTLDVEKLNP